MFKQIFFLPKCTTYISIVKTNLNANYTTVITPCMVYTRVYTFLLVNVYWLLSVVNSVIYYVSRRMLSAKLHFFTAHLP